MVELIVLYLVGFIASVIVTVHDVIVVYRVAMIDGERRSGDLDLCWDVCLAAFFSLVWPASVILFIVYAMFIVVRRCAKRVCSFLRDQVS